jgi:hypothetical protein
MITTTLAAAASLWAIPPHVPQRDVLLMRAWYVQNDQCRGSYEPTKACAWRDDTQRTLAARGWSWSSRWGWTKARPAR